MSKKLVFLLLACMIFSGCQSEFQPGFMDMSRDLLMKEIYHLPSGRLSDLAWLDSQTIIMDIDEVNYPKIEALNIDSSEVRPIQAASTCKRPSLRGLKILPNQLAGFILDCPDKEQNIKEIDLINGITKDIYIELSFGHVGEFTYSHNMKELILVDVNGLYLESSLYYLDASGNRANITPDFQRADFPVWSPTDDVVAFLGTKPYSGSDDPKNFNQIENLFDYPWKLYLYNPKDKQIVELPLEIVHPSRFKWSPDGKMLAFTGEYKGAPGVWIIANLDTPDKLTLTRIVDGFAGFDFSPDSKSLAFVYGGLQNTEKHNIIYVIDLPEQNGTP